jgi:N-acetylneuraminic acid mutarotase
MKKAMAAVGAILLACGGDDRVAPTPETWTERASLPEGALTAAVSFVLDDRIYVGTGLRNSYTGSFYAYDPARDSWATVASLPSDERAHAVGFAIGDFGYVGLGHNCVGAGLCSFQYFNDLWRYDPRDDTWTRVADFPGTPRAFASSFVVGGRAYVTGGGSFDQIDTWEYDPAGNSWTRKADYPGQCVGRGTAFSLGGRGYVGLGYSDGPCRDFWRYDPASDTWTAIATFPGAARWDALGFSAADVAYVASGAQDTTYLADLWSYDPADDTWARLPTTLPGAGRSQMIAGVVGTGVFLGLGTSDEFVGPTASFDDLWEYAADR